MNEICIRAGENVYEVIQDGGFDFDRVTTYVGAASGPRWLVASGFDLSLLENGVLGNLGNPYIFFHSLDSPLNEYTGCKEQRAGVQSRSIRIW